MRSGACSLGDTISEYEVHFNVKIAPMLEPFDGNPDNYGKYFKFLELDTGHWQAVDIHIIRDGQEICPKQDLSFSLEPQDVVELGELIC
ncbi:hypothetical protein [Xanthomonas campestris]|uniref:hypothetical protein n=1 Tax=Xanthomonas campestris TaxID=339 RepID=UPI00128FCCE0|nr:hypothetical protein [Xanthomonas campestris]